jgi:hypothetical protein
MESSEIVVFSVDVASCFVAVMTSFEEALTFLSCFGFLTDSIGAD